MTVEGTVKEIKPFLSVPSPRLDLAKSVCSCQWAVVELYLGLASGCLCPFWGSSCTSVCVHREAPAVPVCVGSVSLCVYTVCIFAYQYFMIFLRHTAHMNIYE